jgi:hypothetical protein
MVTFTPCRFTPGEKNPGTRWLGGWVEPRTGLDDREKSIFLTLPDLELRALGRSAHSESSYRLSYLGTFMKNGRSSFCWNVTMGSLEGAHRRFRGTHWPIFRVKAVWP